MADFHQRCGDSGWSVQAGCPRQRDCDQSAAAGRGGGQNVCNNGRAGEGVVGSYHADRDVRGRGVGSFIASLAVISTPLMGITQPASAPGGAASRISDGSASFTFMCDAGVLAPWSALITGSLRPFGIGDRSSHFIPSPGLRYVFASCADECGLPAIADIVNLQS